LDDFSFNSSFDKYDVKFLMLLKIVNILDLVFEFKLAIISRIAPSTFSG
jgi:hypothetical protein